MACTVTHDASIGIIEVVCSGHITANDLEGAVTERISLEKETGVSRILMDVSAAQLSATFIDLVDIPEKLYEALGANRRSRITVVLPASHDEQERWRFFETACTNRGWMVEVFSERQTAMDWLLST